MFLFVFTVGYDLIYSSCVIRLSENMIITNQITGRFFLIFDAPALAAGIFVVEPVAVTTTFFIFLCHKLFELNDENILV